MRMIAEHRIENRLAAGIPEEFTTYHRRDRENTFDKYAVAVVVGIKGIGYAHIPTDVVYCNGADPEKMHNFYTYLYNKAVYEILEKKRGKGEAVLFARSATAGGQKFPVHWGGDCWSDYESMEQSLRGGLSLTSSGFGF